MPSSIAVVAISESNRRIGLQWLRICAAMMVVFFHAAGYLQLIKGNNWGLETVPLWFGGTGVYLFFAISGFLMAKIMTTTTWQDFLVHRLLRIFPAFFCVVILFSGVGLFTGIGPEFDPGALLLTPLGQSIRYPLLVEWTLVFEIAFYLVVALVIMAKWQEKALPILVGWLVLVLLSGFIFPERPVTSLFAPYHLLLSVHTVAFIAGMLFPISIRSNRAPHPAIVVLAVFVAYWFFPAQEEIIMRWVVGVVSALLVFSIAEYRPFGDRDFNLLDRIGDRLGGYTYAFYLVHIPVIRTFYEKSTTNDPKTLLISAVLLTVVVAIPMGELDLFLYRRLKAKADALDMRLKSFIAAGFIVIFFVSCLVGSL